jgi:hypothetical protein
MWPTPTLIQPAARQSLPELSKNLRRAMYFVARRATKQIGTPRNRFDLRRKVAETLRR